MTIIFLNILVLLAKLKNFEGDFYESFIFTYIYFFFS